MIEMTGTSYTSLKKCHHLLNNDVYKQFLWNKLTLKTPSYFLGFIKRFILVALIVYDTFLVSCSGTTKNKQKTISYMCIKIEFELCEWHW